MMDDEIASKPINLLPAGNVGLVGICLFLLMRSCSDYFLFPFFFCLTSKAVSFIFLMVLFRDVKQHWGETTSREGVGLKKSCRADLLFSLNDWIPCEIWHAHFVFVNHSWHSLLSAHKNHQADLFSFLFFFARRKRGLLCPLVLYAFLLYIRRKIRVLTLRSFYEEHNRKCLPELRSMRYKFFWMQLWANVFRIPLVRSYNQLQKFINYRLISFRTETTIQNKVYKKMRCTVGNKRCYNFFD